ncbi:hypothetical protein [uncultured Massilia sp.]|uniref:hypothetical protein n=1 Tax=uncultured Massilia sp. TaxID=169973 RepID=UPI0025FEB351|nr:hypothetical protein [uncultured Massilia sp.]
MSKQKGPDSNRSRSIGKEKTMTVAEGSQQPRAPGWVAPGSANVQSANIEQLGAALRARGTLQGGIDDSLNVQRSSARQSGQRLQARGEEDRLNASRQSGYGGAEQRQASGAAAHADAGRQKPSDAGSRPGKKGGRGR